MAYDTQSFAHHQLTMEGRERLTVSGVEDVERFDENVIVMSTSVGTLVVSGERLHIGKLSLDGGELHVDGSIESLCYEDTARGGGFFSRLQARALFLLYHTPLPIPSVRRADHPAPFAPFWLLYGNVSFVFLLAAGHSAAFAASSAARLRTNAFHFPLR